MPPMHVFLQLECWVLAMLTYKQESQVQEMFTAALGYYKVVKENENLHNKVQVLKGGLEKTFKIVNVSAEQEELQKKYWRQLFKKLKIHWTSADYARRKHEDRENEVCWMLYCQTSAPKPCEASWMLY